MNLSARTAIEALRAGVPNRSAVRLMGPEEAGIEHDFDVLLQAVWSDGPATPTGLGIAGGFGAGKSHMLGYLAEVARAQKFVVSRVVISKETPLSDPARLFEAAVRTAILPGRNDDALAACLAILREQPAQLDALEQAVSRPGSGIAPVFAAILFLLRKPSTPAALIRRCERFLAGGRTATATFRQALVAAGAARMFDVRMPPAAELAAQRIRFVAELFRAAGFAGWCLLLDEVELIGRYTPLQRALAYAWLATWLGLDGAAPFPGIVTAYAITDDFAAAVIDQRQDDEKLPERLRLKGKMREAEQAKAAIRHIERTVVQRRLQLPGNDDLARAQQKLRGLYETAYDWKASPLPQTQRTATGTMRQYIKAWITLWDLRRLGDGDAGIVHETMTTDYREDADLAAPPAPAEEETD